MMDKGAYRFEERFTHSRTNCASSSRGGESVGGSNMQQQLIITPSHQISCALEMFRGPACRIRP